ncbi:MAG: DUF5606 domain-containing protein [Bacteroidales bacterium]|nr:DUF5606 domain-containing protein [Bacteroidales bacterium]
MDLSKILVISGKPGLFELVSQTKGGAIVESLIDHKRCPVFHNDRISSLNEISIFTDDDDKPLREILQDIFRKENEQAVALDPKKASNDEVFKYFGEVLPNYDHDRVHASDVKKILSWYNLLISAGKIDLKESEEETTEETKAE